MWRDNIVRGLAMPVPTMSAHRRAVQGLEGAEEIVQARQDWMGGSRFGEVKGYDGVPLPAPELPPVPLKPRGRVR
jgi:hypothetical protein